MIRKTGMGRKAAVWALALCLALGGAVGVAEEATSYADVMRSAMSGEENLTLGMHFTMRQNEADPVEQMVLLQSGEGRVYMAANMTDENGKAMALEASVEDGTCVLHVGDAYFEIATEDIIDAYMELANAGLAEAEREDGLAGLSGDEMEQIASALLAHLSTTDDGFSLHLSGDDIPEGLNAILSAAGGQGDTDADGTARRMGSDLRFVKIDMDANTAQDSEIVLTCSFVLTGLDADGEALETALDVTCRVTGQDETKPATIDTDGVEVEQVDSLPEEVSAWMAA